MTAPATTAAPKDKGLINDLTAWERGALALFAGIFLYLAVFATFHRNINWDEFHFLSQVYQYDQGRLTYPLQTFHVHFFGWLTWLPLSDPSQVIAGRVVMLLLELCSFYALFLIARQMFGFRPAILVVVTYATSGFLIEHGTSFRTDPVVVFALMSSLAILVTSRLDLTRLALAALLAAVGLLVSIKGALYLPAFAGAFIWRWRCDGFRWALLKFAATGALLLVFYGLLWALHVSSLEVAQALETSRNNASAALGKTALFSDLFPREYHIRIFFRDSLLFWPALAVGACCALYDLVFANRARGAAVLLFALPIASLLFYRNAYPYFFPYIMAPVALIAGAAFVRAARPLATVIVAFVALYVLVNEAPRYLGKDQEAQRVVHAAAIAAFPEPVPYIDRAGMVPSYPKVGYFMTSWGIESAQATGRDVIADTIVRSQPQFVIVNAPSLEDALSPVEGLRPKIRLSDTDAESLRDNFIHHWGALWVAGKELAVGPQQSTFELVIAGEYTVECSVPSVRVDGKAVACGDTVTLEVGEHAISAGEVGTVTLRIGKDLPRPDSPMPDSPIFHRL